MKNTQIVAERIKTKSKQSGVTVKKLLEDCSLGVNTVTKMSAGNDILSQNLLKIADYLGCSVDYLLGRTDEPNTNEPAVNVSGSQQNLPTEQARELDNEFSTLLLRLSLRERVELMSMIYKYVDEHSGK